MIRLVGEEADRLGVTRPSYERLRQLVHATRAVRRRRGPSLVEVLVETGAGIRPLGSAKDAVAAPRDERR